MRREMINRGRRGGMIMDAQRDYIRRAGPDKGFGAGLAGRLLYRVIIAVLVLMVFSVTAAQAVNPDGNLRIEIISAYNLVVDSNVTTPATYAPEAATLGAKVCNDGTEVMNEVQVYIGDYATETPGTYPGYDSSVAGAPDHVYNSGTGTGTYSLTHESGSFANNEDASRAWVGTLQPGECRVEYWVVSYPRCVNVETSPGSGVYVPQEPPCATAITGGSTTADDIALSYDIWANGLYDGNGNGLADDDPDPNALEASDRRGLTLRSEISASANKIWPNGDNKVPDEYKDAIEQVHGWDTWTPTGNNPFPGQVFETQGIWYDLGNVNKGFDNNNDGVPDQNAWVQPVGIPDVYDPGCFRLVGTYGLLIVKLSSGGEQLIPFKDQMYFENIPDNTGVVGLVFYEYAALNGKCTGTLTPYQEVASGSYNEKFSGDYGTAFQITTQEPLAYITKNDYDTSGNLDPLLSPGSNIVYQLAVTNPDNSVYGGLAVTVGDPDSGNPLVIRDRIPAGTNFVQGSAIVTSGSDIVPTDVTILYTYDNGSLIWTSSVAPVTQAETDQVVALEWRAETGLTSSTTVGQDRTLTVQFEVTVPSGYTEPYVSNIGCAAIGSGPCFDEDDAVTPVAGSYSITGEVFLDDGTGGGIVANGIKDGVEPGEDQITVTLYLDVNGDGLLDDGDIKWGEAESLTASGYLFDSLPPEQFLVVVDDNDSNLTAGVAPTTDVVLVADLTDPTQLVDSDGDSTPDRLEGIDFGFLPPLGLIKNLVGSSPVYEGREATYQIYVQNQLPPAGTATASGGCEYILWGKAESTTITDYNKNPWDDVSNIFQPSGPDGVYASAPFNTNNEEAYVTGFNMTDYNGAIGAGDTVEIIIPAVKNGFVNTGNDFDVYTLLTADESVLTTSLEPNIESYALVDGMVVFDITSQAPAGGWNWDSFQNYTIMLQATKSGNEPGTLLVDAVGYRIITDQACPTGNIATALNPVPLEDDYDETKMQFVSADPSPTSTAGGKLIWDNVGPINAGETKTVSVTYKVIGTVDTPSVLNTASSVDSKFADGTDANSPVQDTEDVPLEAAGSLEGYIWNEGVSGPNGWIGADGYEATDVMVPGALVELYLCADPAQPGVPAIISNDAKTCVFNGGVWEKIDEQVTDANGYYKFEGLLDGYYTVKSVPSSFTSIAAQTGDPDDTSGDCSPSNCDDYWKNQSANLNQVGVITSSNEDITNVNFGYDVGPVIFGNVWEDVDGQGDRDTGDIGIPGDGSTTVKVDLLDCGIDDICGNGDDGSTVSTYTDADGNYHFDNLIVGHDYRISVDTSTLPGTGGWTETAETDGVLQGTDGGIQINDIGAGVVSGSHDFGFYQTGTNSIGDRLYADLDGDGVEDVGEPGVPNVTIYLYEDSGSIPGVLDPGDVLRATQVTDSNGNYDFIGLPDGNYLVIPNENDPDFPQLTQTADPDESGVCTVCNGLASVSVSGGQDIDTADFGYKPTGGMIGDSIYWDVNGDGTQGTGEPGIEGVEVYLCTEPVASLPCDPTDSEYVGTSTTDNDGKYLFYGLPDDDYTVSVGSRPGDPQLTADPDTDGVVCTDTNPVCDNNHNVTVNGNSYMGADFGYEPPLFIGDQVFIDADGSGGNMDGNDQPLAYVTVTLTDGTNTYTVETDENGNYAFVNGASDLDGKVISLTNGNTYTVTVDPNDFPTEYGALTPSYNGPTDAGQVDTDGATDNSITLTLGADPIVDADLGYRFNDTGLLNNLNGTVCLESDSNGYCGINGDGDIPLTNGIDTSAELAYEGTTVYVSKWIDAGIIGVIEPGELFPITQTVTDVNGDYFFTDLPSVGETKESYIVSLEAPADLLELTTEPTGDTPATLVDKNNEPVTGYTTSAWQIISVADGSSTVGMDFAFEQTVAFDFGDLPLPFETTLNIDGARHIVPETPGLYLGAGVTREVDGQPSPGAIADEDDGIVPVDPACGSSVSDTTSWNATDGGAVQVTAVGDGWLVGWIDFNGDGSLNGANEMIINEALSGGDTPKCITFSIPADAVDLNGDFKAPGFARFRLFPKDAPALLLPRFAFKGVADNGEVEDYLFNLGVLNTIGDEILQLNADGSTTGIPGVVVELQNDYCNPGVDCPTAVTDANGNYLFTGVGLGDYTVVVKEGVDGLTQVYDPDSTMDGQHPVSITTAGTEYLDADFWYAASASASTTGTIGDRIWNDANGDGIQDMGESGIGGITVELQDGVCTPSDNCLTTTTAADGSYSFTNLPAGNYTIEVTDPPAGTTQTGDPDGTVNNSTTVILSAGQVFLTADFGYQYDEAATSDIGDRIWFDTNEDGIQDAGESGLAGVTVVLKDSSGKVIAADVTDGNGNYLFPDVPPGTYTVEVTDANGVLTSYGLKTYPSGTDVTSNPSYTFPTATVGGTDYLDVDLGYIEPIPTYALVSTFKAYINGDKQVALEWKTSSEIGTLGFLLERLNEQSGKYQAVTKQLLPGMLSPPHGGTYRYVDKTAKMGRSYTYRVVEVAVNNQGVVSGPYTVQASEALPVNNRMFDDGPEGYSLTHQKFSKKELQRFTARSESALELAVQQEGKTGNVLKIPVSKNGLVYLTAAELATSSGFAQSQVVQYLKAKECLVTLAGNSIPVITANTGSGLWFYGQAPERNDIGLNIYLLELGVKGVAMKNTPGRAEERVDGEQFFTAHVKVEENHQPINLYTNTAVRDFWAWEYLFAYGGEAAVNHVVNSPYLINNGDATITVNLVGMMNSNSGQAAPYKVAVLLNGTEIGSAEWSSQGDYQLRTEVAADLLLEGGNEVRIVSRLNTGVLYSFIYLESIEIDYPRSFEVSNGELFFQDGGYERVTVQGFSDSNVLALDITDPVKPKRLRTFPSKNEAGEYEITVRTESGHDYFLTENIGTTVTGVITVDTPSALRRAGNEADYLIITSLNLLDSAQRLAAHRSSQGMISMVVDIEDIQDEFSYSLAAPEAVHDFLTYVYENWSTVPRYVALIGDGSYDYKDYLGYGYPTVPSVLVQTDEGFYPSDNFFVDVVGDDNVPEFAVGRIPVVDTVELDNYIDKLISYEQSNAGLHTKLTLATDRTDSLAGSFQPSGDKVQALMPESFTVNRFVVDDDGVSKTHAGIVDALQQGSGILHYIGHGSMVALGRSSSLLTASEVDSMSPVGPSMLMVSMVCSSASFGYPAMRGLGETAVLRPDGAAVGFFGATGLSLNYLADIMAEGFYRSLFDSASSRLGDAVKGAKEYYGQQGEVSYPLDIYNLLGDPATLIPVEH